MCVCVMHYHNAVAGSGGEVDVVRVGRDPAVSILDVLSHILPDALDPLTGAVGPLNTTQRTLIGAEWRRVDRPALCLRRPNIFC